MQAARAFAIAANVTTTQLRIYNCRSRISLKLQQNEIDFAAQGKFMLVNLSLQTFWVLQAWYRVTQKDAYPYFVRLKTHFLTNVFTVAGRDR